MFDIEWNDTLVYLFTLALVVVGPAIALGIMAIAELWHRRRSRGRGGQRALQRGLARWRTRRLRDEPVSTPERLRHANGKKVPLQSIASEEETAATSGR